MPHLKQRPGFALPTAILVVGIMTVALAASFTLISAERRTVDDQQLQVRALGIAQQGIEAYLRHPENPAFRPGRATHIPAWDRDTAWIPVNPATGDTAIVVPRYYRLSTSNLVDTTYVLSSTGRQGIGVVKGTPAAVRTVAEIVTWTGRTIPVKAGWMSLTGLLKNGSSGTISGNDAASPACLATGDVAGVSVPTNPGYTQNGGSSPLSGNPPLDNTSLGGTPQSAADTMAKAGLDWARWSQGLNLPNVWRLSDHGGALPSFADPNYYPIVYTSGDMVLPDGQGMLVVKGNLIINGGTTWKGIVLVGSGVDANGSNTVIGAVLSGLNMMISPAPIGPGSLGNGTKVIQYNSCEVKKALSGTRALVPRSGTWMDNWKTY